MNEVTFIKSRRETGVVGEAGVATGKGDADQPCPVTHIDVLRSARYGPVVRLRDLAQIIPFLGDTETVPGPVLRKIAEEHMGPRDAA